MNSLDQNINEYSIFFNPLDIKNLFMNNFPHLNMYQERATSCSVIITSEDVDEGLSNIPNSPVEISLLFKN